MIDHTNTNVYMPVDNQLKEVQTGIAQLLEKYKFHSFEISTAIERDASKELQTCIYLGYTPVVIEDVPEINRIVKEYIEANKYTVHIEFDGIAYLKLKKEEERGE